MRAVHHAYKKKRELTNNPGIDHNVEEDKDDDEGCFNLIVGMQVTIAHSGKGDDGPVVRPDVCRHTESSRSITEAASLSHAGLQYLSWISACSTEASRCQMSACQASQASGPLSFQMWLMQQTAENTVAVGLSKIA